MNKKNLIDTTTETWKPPPLKPQGHQWKKGLSWTRRFFDLQAGSIWQDLKHELQNAEGHLLDVGCGAQPYRSLIPSSVKYIGMDIAESKEKFGYQESDTLYYSGQRWPVNDESMDIVLCTETLEHVAEPDAFLAETFRCLRTGGKFIFSVPFSARWHFIPFDYWRYTPSSLSLLLNRAGFSEIVVYGRGNALTVACYKVMALFLHVLLPQNGNWRQWIGFPLGLIGLPVFLFLAIVANLSLKFNAGDDCLGFTGRAQKLK